MSLIKAQFPLDFQWPTRGPFLFCVHHLDKYPAGDSEWAPNRSLLQGRDLGQDFVVKDGFRMYHGNPVPGFPVHPHRGFETITIVRQGFVDHADSLGAAGRYGAGDVQWMTAGGGVQHSEMFPLLHSDKENPAELFQIWLNLPKKSKMVPAHFKMLWREKIPVFESADKKLTVHVIAGEYSGLIALSPPPASWASEPESHTLILLVRMKSGGKFQLPAAPAGVNRMLYFFAGQEISVDGKSVLGRQACELNEDAELKIEALSEECEILILQSKPIGEPVVQYGPFVMTTKAEIQQTFEDYQKTQFGGWPWPREDMVHGGKLERFAKTPDGKVERP